MSLSVHELLLCCRGLENEKATERKKEIDRFKRLLRDPETVKELDRTSALKASRNNNQLTWDAVFRFLKKYLQKETELLQSGKANVSAITQANRRKKMQEISSLIKYFVRCANKRGPKLKCSDLLAHVVEVMQSSFSCSAYGEDYSSMLLKNILSVRKYWCEITQQQWHTLLELYCGLFTGTSKPINRVLVSRIIHTVVQGCCLQTEGLSHTLFNFFSRALNCPIRCREERQLTILEHLISALNVFLRSVAINCRRRVCRLGEELLPSILYVWSQKRPSSTLKEEMVEFFNLQMCVHHPKGAKTLETGNDAPKLWQSLLYNLYDALVSEISQIGSRGKYATGARHIAVKENLIELTADICHQVINRYIHSVTDLQYSLQRDSPQSSKRRRVELGWEVLRDHLQPQHNDFDMIPWLQVTAALTSKYPSMLPAHELLPLLSLLGQLLGEQQRRGERRPYVLRCLRQVALCQAAGSASVGTSEAQQREVSRLWSRVWAMAVRGVSSAQTEGLCLELLRTMVQCSLVPVDREFWKLFSAAICKPSTLCGLKLYYIKQYKTLKYKRNQGLITVLFGSFSRLCPPDQPVAAAESKSFLSEVEALYLQFSFDDADSLTEIREGRTCRENPQLTVVSGLRTRVEQSLLSVAEHLLNSYSPDSTVTPPAYMVHCLKLLTGVLGAFVCVGVITEEDACHSSLYIFFNLPHSESVCFSLWQDSVSTVSRSLFVKALPGRLLTELSDICKLMVSYCIEFVCNIWQSLGLLHLLNCKMLHRNTCSRLKRIVTPLLYILFMIFSAINTSCRIIKLLLNCVLHTVIYYRLFLEKAVQRKEQKKMLPLKHQQTAFENVYLKAQEGMKIQRNSPPEDLPDESFNRRATLLKSLSVVMCCSPVCEKQALFALFQSYKENGIEEQLIKKVLGSVSRSLGYRSSKAFVCSHLYYLVAEWLSQRETDPSYTLQSFPYTLLNYSTLEEFYRSSYHVLIPHLVFLNDFEQVRSIGSHLQEDWKKLLGRCFPKLMVNILPHFALPGQDAHAAQQREKAHRVYDLLKDNDCLGKQQIDNLICSNLADIVVELLMTLYEGAEGGGLQKFIGELDPAPNPPFFNSKVIKATLDYLSNCHSANHKSLVTILSKTPMSIQKILASICERAAETTNAYERHRILMMYHLFVNLLLQEVKDGLGGAWAFVLRDIIYTLIHQINSRSLQQDEVSTRSLALCCDLLTTVCKTAVLVCDDALESHLQVIVGTLTAQVTERPVIAQQVLHLLKFLVIDNPDNRYLRRAIPLLEPFPDRPAFRELRAAQHQLKYSSRTFSLRQEIDHFLSVASCDSLPLTRLEGLKDLKRQLHTHKQQMEQLLKECHGNTLIELSHFVALEAVGGCLGELGPVDLSTIALHHGKDQIYTQAAELFPDALHQWIFIILSCINNALTHHSISIRQAAAQCLKDVLATQPGLDFWEKYKSQRDPMLLYLSPFRSTKRKVMEVPLMSRDRLDSLELWSVNPGSHKDWLRRLCIALLDSGGIQNEALLMTRPLCEVKTDFCQRVLPLFIHNMLLEDRNGSWRELLSTHIQRFFSLCSRPANPSSRPTTPLLPDSGPFFPDKCSLRTMLAVIDYLRKQSRPLRPGRFSNFWLDLNYLEVARAAQLCSAHFTALLYSEIYVDNIRSNMEEKRRITFDDSSQNLSIGSVSEKSVEDSGISLQDLLIDVYRSIGEPDSLYGCGGGKLINPLTSIHVKIIFKLRLFSLFCRSEKLNPGFNESLFTALQALKDKDFFVFEEALKYARGNGVEELCRGNLEAVSSLYPTLCSLQMIEELQSVKALFVSFQTSNNAKKTSSYSFQVLRVQKSIFGGITLVSNHLERAVFQMKQRSGVSKGMSTVDSWAWQLEEAQVFWVKKEEGLALALLRQMIDKLWIFCVDINPAVVPVYSECLRLCGSWLSETCLESPAVILESYLERAVEAFEDHGGAPDPKQQSQMTQAFLSLARFSDAQYQGIENYMRSSEFENKQALLEKAKEEVDLMKERNVTNNRYTVKVQRELELDVRALANLRADRRRFLLKAVENYIRCLELGEEHDTWIFRLASLWLENADVKNVNDMMKEGVKKIPSYKFLPLMYQLAARMGTKLSNLPTQEEAGFHSVLNELICRASMDHPHHTLFIILALVNANKDESFSRSRLSRNSARQPSPLDLERAEVAQKIINVIRKQKAQMIQGIETLCSAYITLAYMDASRHKTEKSELILLVLAFNKHAPIPLKKKSGVELDSVKKLKEAQRMEFDKKLQAFTEVCQNFRPVFRYFCMERFLDPAVWLEKRLAYTRSVATSSIVGYIVGLGDRHIQNILIDEQTAELVHIDLGVAFEQGKILPTPETVPFRLSRDIVDGMGITGVEGVFRRCCEKTMEVMRSSQEVLLTIVEVCAKVCRHLLKAEIGVIRREKHPLLQEKLLLFWIGFILNCRTFRVN
uniref:ATM serine/threonine kinase n=1 Tax=Astyanax mexicanus TaxID=7994 RepID=A0A8B9JDB5_ASTMX